MLEVDDSEKRKLLHEKTTSKLIGAAFEVHDQLGYEFLERVYNAHCKWSRFAAAQKRT